MKGKRTLEAPKLLGIIWPFVAVVLFQALLGSISLYALSAVRGYVGGESLWSKGQKDAIYYLTLYADSGDQAAFEKYQRAIAVPMGGMSCAPHWICRHRTSQRLARACCRVATTPMTSPV